jgi:hypothetical protein
MQRHVMVLPYKVVGARMKFIARSVQPGVFNG